MSPTDTERGLLARGGMLELVGQTEAAKILGVKHSNNVTQLKGLPAPVVDYLKAGRLWLRRDIEAFARRRSDQAGGKV